MGRLGRVLRTLAVGAGVLAGTSFIRAKEIPPCSVTYDSLVAIQDSQSKFFKDLDQSSPVDVHKDVDDILTPALRPNLEKFIAEFAQKDSDQSFHDSLRALYDTLGRRQRTALAERFGATVPRIHIKTKAQDFYAFSLKYAGANTLADSLDVAIEVRAAVFSAFTDKEVSFSPANLISPAVTFYINPYNRASPLETVLHESVHAIQFSYRRDGLGWPCISQRPHCVIAREGQAEYFELWLQRSSSFSDSTVRSLAPKLRDELLRRLPTEVPKQISPFDHFVFNAYVRGRTVFAQAVVEYGLDSATHLFSVLPPCATPPTGHPR